MKRALQQGWRPLLVLILFFVCWELIVRTNDVPKWILPAPSVIMREAGQSFSLYRADVWSTVGLSITGFIIGSLIGVLLAVMLHLLPRVRQALYPFLIMSQNVPIIVLAPLLIIWFGFGLLPKLIILFLVCFFPVAVAALDGFRQTPHELNQYFRMAGASTWQMFRKLEFPHALPSIFSGLKISATYSVMGAVVSEWLGAKQGIGVFMTLASASFRTDRVFVAIFMIMCLSLFFFVAIVLLQRLVIRWNAGGEDNR